MIIAAVIRKENQILLQRTSERDNLSVWELPNCAVFDGTNPIDYLIKKCKTLNVTIDVTDVFFEGELDNSRIVVYNTNLLEYSNSNNSACWVDTNELVNLSFTNQYVEAVKKFIQESDISNSINREIENVVLEVCKTLGLKVEPMTSYNSVRVFMRSDYGGYCPFIFCIDYAFESKDDIKFFYSWRITRMYAEGDKSDLYFLFANLMTVFLKCIFQKNVYIDYLSLFVDYEINAALIIFNETYKNFDIKKLKEVVEESYVMYTMCLVMFENLIGSFSLNRDDTKFIARYDEFLYDQENYNCFSREEHQYYSNLEKGISLLCINNGVYNAQRLLVNHQWKYIDGIDGKILHQVDFGEESFNYVSYEDLERISKVIKEVEIKDYTIVCQTNHLYLLEKNNIWIFEGDFSEYRVTIEKEKIMNRQSIENKILYFNRVFNWRYPVKPGRFEELIADLVETDIMVQNVRLLGKSNNADGGRDLLIFKKYMKEDDANGTVLIIGQCKAYEKSVNKSHVRDIRDTLDFYNAAGFFLAVTSGITAQLVDHLCKLKEKRDIDWWTEREIFKKLRQNPNIASRYLDILLVEN